MGRRGLQFFASYDTIYVELISLMFLFLWGGWLLLPFDTFGRTAVYRMLGQLAPEWVWCGLAVGLGFARVGARAVQPVRRGLLFGSMLLWLFIGMFSLLSSPWSTAGILYISFSVIDGMLYLRAGLNDH